ncbi:tail fiber assembly protein [Pseudomonas sp. NBRC 111140]|uniref:tail fiber assembly protein n=1 Tax=Pseudomonas sp. NBRC 111140 TaxID=1661055 RepID=UPI000A5800CD|nr:tail fiber assembly protein [Pseudomonas sp. NBRC 111140]
MIIKLSPIIPLLPQSLTVYKQGDSLTINGLTLDFSQLPDGGTLPGEASRCPWIIETVERVQGQLVIVLLLPIPIEASQEACFPCDIISPPDGLVALPTPDAEQPAPAQGYAAIDWSQVVTAEDKARAASEQRRASVIVEIAHQRTLADTAIAPLQDAVDLEDATAEEVNALKAWKRYRVALNRLPEQPGFPDSMSWPDLPA